MIASMLSAITMFGAHVPSLLARSASTSSPSAFSFTPSQNWDGNDGAWSSFVIRIGTPSQYFRVLPALSSPSTYVPLPLNCSLGVSYCGNARGVEPFKSPSTAVSTNVSTIDPGFTCSANRGPSCENCVSINGKCTTGPCAGQYCCGAVPGACNSAGCNGVSGLCTQAYIGCPCTGDDWDATTSPKDPGAVNPVAALGFWGTSSSTWSGAANHSLLTNSDSPAGFPPASNGSFGWDLLGLGPTPGAGLSLSQKSLVAGAPTEPFFIGSLGLQPSNSSRFNHSSPSALMLLKDEELIPSLSYGYTAGAIYREQGILGSLTLGGYDTARFVPNDVTFPISISDTAPRLQAGLQSITASNTFKGNTTLLSSNISIVVDSSSPFLYLPAAACPLFEQAFGLTWNPSLNLYQPNTSAHGKLRTANPSLIFRFGPSPSNSVNITVPYQAFDLQTTAPITQNGTNYFPLRCSNDPSQMVLGRAFLQEAYILADYEKGNFSISQADFSGKTSNIVAIDHSASPSSDSSSITSRPSSAGSHLSSGAIAGIAVGASVFAISLVALLLFCCRIRHKQRTIRDAPQDGPPVPEKESWPSSPATSPIAQTGTMTSTDPISPLHRFEERLERLERERAQASRPQELDNSWANEHSPPQYSEDRPKQELPGSATAAEMAERSARTSRNDRSWYSIGRPRPAAVRHVAELAGDDYGKEARPAK